jgi:type VI protein secretion system component VasF
LACGQALDIVDAMFNRLTSSTVDQLHRVREGGMSAKAREEEASEDRLAEMWAEEERRRQALAQARAERERQERVMINVALGVVAFIVLVAIVVAVVW